MNNPKVRILLAAWNGAAYLRPLLDSLLAQDVDCFQIVASDDGSTDETPAILDAYAAQHPGRMVRYRAPQRFGSAQGHFWHLMTAFADTPYLMFCDQDDIWHPDKVRRTLERMEIMDQSCPALVHTNLRVVDRELREIAPSFLRYAGLDGQKTYFNRLLVQNVVTGCTVMINRALARLAASAPPEKDMLMHDWWLALLASSCGLLAFLPEATIDYRQHGGNAVGAKDARSLSYLLGRLRGDQARTAYWRCILQARAFLRAYGDELSPAWRGLCRAFAETPQRGKFSRIACYRRMKLWKQGLPRCIGQILWW